MADHAQAFFHRDWNTWAVGYYDSRRAGTAEAYTTFADQAAAERAADEFNRDHRPRARRETLRAVSPTMAELATEAHERLKKK